MYIDRYILITVDNDIDIYESEEKVMSDNYSNVCCFTGHRPERLEMPQKKVIRWLNEQVEQAISDGYTKFISGMQRGVDIWAAEAVLRCKKEKPELKLIAACAFDGMENRWDKCWQDRYNSILKESEEVHYIGSYPSRASFFKRDEWMVDHSNRVIGVYTGAPGGTLKTINYAKKKGLEVVLIDR